MKRHLIKKAVAMVALLASCGGVALAESGGAFAEENFSSTLTFTTDYVFRGVSFTSEDPAVQGSFDWGYNNWYAGIWGTNIELPNSSLELDYYLGYANSTTGGLDYDFTLIYYNFPSAEDDPESDQWEIWGNFGYGIQGLLSPYLGLFLAYSPDFTLEDGDGLYAKASLGLSFDNAWGLDFGYGYQDVEGDKGSDGYSYTHWDVGVSKEMKGFGLDLRYHDTEEDSEHEAFLGIGNTIYGDRIVFSISRSF